MIPTFAGFNTGLSAPAAPTLSYTAQGQFTITNYNASLTYAVIGATRSGNLLTGVSNGATITAAYSAGAPVSNASTMNVLAGARVLYGAVTSVTSTGCGGQSAFCPAGQITDPSGGTGGCCGSVAPDNFCDVGFGNYCDPGNCYQITIGCQNWYWTNYTANGYTLFGGDSGTWGKATNG
jgi:hypothetical protein